VFGNKYLLLELNKLEAELYHLPDLVPYHSADQKKLTKDGFDWNLAVKAMKTLIKEDDCDEYKLYKLFVRKWDLYEELTKLINNENFKEAEKIVDKILSIDLLDPSAYLNLGLIFRSQKEYYKSEQAYLKGLDLVIYRTPFLTGLAKTYEALGKFEDAIYTWNQVANESHNHEALEKLIEHKVYLGSIEDLKKQKITQQESLNLEPGINFETLMRKEFQKSYNDVEALTKLGTRLVHHKLTELAVRVFERVYQLSQVQGVVLTNSMG
jgi:tetratricopeptide (TPR) repeat protein